MPFCGCCNWRSSPARHKETTMTAKIRTLLSATLLSFCATAALAAQAQTYPAKPVTVIVPFPPGAGVDIVTRLVMAKLATALDQPFVIENRSGEIGKASCRERVCQYVSSSVVAVSLHKKKHK